ncbi:hypothetical protein [Nocardia sp. 348MFTsu5.1]|nr:hypothetical protein [Nocardia sp. 348MFTsu5.1]
MNEAFGVQRDEHCLDRRWAHVVVALSQLLNDLGIGEYCIDGVSQNM